MSKFCVLIPTLNPTENLIQLIATLTAQVNVAIIIVNDGSNLTCQPIFDRLVKYSQVVLLNHAVNLGKGAALKTGLNYAFLNYPDLAGIVTADGDGQHTAEDILAVGKMVEQHPNQLIVGSRNFSRDVPVPYRSKVGNLITRKIFKTVVGMNISDTQSGLRGIPLYLVPNLLEIKSQRYEFELEMLLKYNHSGKKIIEQSIHTIYLDGNQSSHFRPIIDSLKIYTALFRSAIFRL